MSGAVTCSTSRAKGRFTQTVGTYERRLSGHKTFEGPHGGRHGGLRTTIGEEAAAVLNGVEY